MERVLIIKGFHGICSMIVCAVKEATDKEILKVCNSQNPSGTTNGWMDVVRDDKEEPMRNPVQCEDYPERLHFIVDC